MAGLGEGGFHHLERLILPWIKLPEFPSSSLTCGDRAGLAALKCPVHADDPDNPASRAGLEQIVETLAAPETGSVARAKAAITVHLEADGRAAPLAQYRPSAGGAKALGETLRSAKASATALFALERAPEPERAEPHGAGSGQSLGGGAPLEERQEVRAHWKRQAYGPRLSKRRRRIIASYKRGPKPEENQIVLTRLAEGERGTRRRPR